MNERRGTKGLELWCRKMTEGYPGVKIENMTTSWRDGLAFCAMIHHFRPDLIDFTKLNKDDVYHNNELAFRVAEQYLGIPALLEPEDMVEYAVPDRLSILTYLSQFYQAFAAREGASSARIAPKRPQVSSDHGIVSPASTSPPTKVALTTATKPRRELCAKCGLPVFIAERLSIGKSLFHRTCFRCARCNSQLTPANYYETENSEFCCELCPDEEKVTSKTSAQKAVLQRSMSDEEKTASLKTFTDEPDEFSAVFESALENADVEKIQTLNREFVSARSNFFSSQLKSSDSNDSETDDKEEEPPDLPKSLPPISSKTDSVISAQSDSFSVNTQPNSTNSAQYDSGFPNKNDVNSGLKVTLSSNKESQNVVTKDESSEESLVKTRRRLFENNVTDIKADVNRKTVPLSTFTSIPSSIKNNRDNVSDIIEDTPHSTHTSFEKGSVKRPLSERQSPTKKYLSSMSLEVNEKSNIMENNQQQNMLTQSIDKDTNVSSVADSSLDEGISKKDTSIYLIDSSQAESRSADCTSKSIEVVNSNEMLTKETPESPVSSQVISNDIEESMKEINSYIEDMKSLEENSSLNATNESQQASSNSIESKLTTSVESDPKLSATDELNSKIIATVDKSFESDDVGIENTENTSIQITSDDPFVSLQEHNGVTEAVNDDVKEQFEGPKETVETINYNVKEVINDSKYEEKVENLNIESDRKLKGNIVETINYNLNEPVLDIHKSKEIVVETINTNVKDFDNSTATSKRPLLEKMESYPDDLNPFDDVEEKQHNQSLNPFGSEDEEEDVGRISKKPIPSPRLKKKVLDASDLRKVMESPMKDVKMTRISVNPFESDDDEKPVPAVRRKKISVPKISLNPFSSDDDESEEIAHKPVPVPRNQRTSGGVHDVKPRDSGGLLHSNIHFGSNSSISSGSYYGSTRKKRPAPKPPIPGFLNDSNASSLTSTPSQSVQHSPKSTPNHRKTKRAPPPPKFTSTPNATPFKSEIQPQTESSKEAGIHSELENAKIVKDEANRNRQSQNLQNEDIEDPNRLSVPNKSTYGKWKRKKGLAPAKPVPQRRTIKCLPMAEIKKELEFIEVQQQGLEKQGVRLEQIIREKCEGTENNTTTADEDIPIEVEDLILQLFELVNEKNELFRKQTELMYLRRQQRLEEEHADVEYQIRCIMMQPEANKTDSDKAREEELIKRLVEIVERRNEIVECLEMDRVREAEEDDSINNHINLFTLSRESDKSNMEVPKKEKSKDKKKPKKEKKSKHKKDKIDVDKDIDTSEVVSTLEKKKKKKFNLFLK